MKGRCLGKPSLPEVTIDETVTTTTTRKWTIRSSNLKTKYLTVNMDLWKQIAQNKKEETENMKGHAHLDLLIAQNL
jgi:hypothetical protein